MRRALAFATLVSAFLGAGRASALGVESDASLGFASPLGSLERGSRVSDTTSGAIPLQLGGALFLTRRIALRASASLAAAIPKLCATASDCEASLGRDVAFELGARLAFPALGRVSPRLDVGFGWEWYAATLSDHGVSSTRSYSGPTFASLAVSAPFRFSAHFGLGPSVGARAGTFTSASQSTPAWTRASLDGQVAHAWLTFAIEARLSF